MLTSLLGNQKPVTGPYVILFFHLYFINLQPVLVDIPINVNKTLFRNESFQNTLMHYAYSEIATKYIYYILIFLPSIFQKNIQKTHTWTAHVTLVAAINAPPPPPPLEDREKMILFLPANSSLQLTTDPVPGLITTAIFIATHLESIICLAFTSSLLVYNLLFVCSFNKIILHIFVHVICFLLSVCVNK